MPWRVGIDEAGYGPNLGPFVMTSVACHVPDDAGCLWKCLRRAVRKHRHKDDGRLLVDDSKLVYSSATGIAALERSVLGFLGQSGSLRLADVVGRLASNCLDELRQESWFHGETSVPSANAADELAAVAESFASCCEKTGVRWGTIRSIVVCPSRFNGLIDRWGSKGGVLSVCLSELLRSNLIEHTGSIRITVDKHGGRNFYGPAIQEAVDDGFVVPRSEGMESVYDIVGPRHRATLTFKPRADGDDLCVALASMVSKYLRELLMEEFNAFWRSELPDLEPTAGYPGDARRFYNAIQPTMAKLGIVERTVWRQR